MLIRLGELDVVGLLLLLLLLLLEMSMLQTQILVAEGVGWVEHIVLQFFLVVSLDE